MSKIQDILMAPFSMAEVINRATVGHAVENAFKGAGHAVADAKGLTPEFVRATRQIVNETQYASHPLNTPLAFISADPNITPFGRTLTNPLVRQFLSFPIRSFTTLAHSVPRFAGREGGLLPIMNDFGRSMAIGAVMYETLKNGLGVDFSRAGPFASTFDIFPGISGGRFDARESPVPIPPVLDIPVSAVRAMATGDKQLMARTFARTMPGGIALSRALGVFPQMPPPASGLQKNYAAWDQRSPDGLIPVFKEDGTLIAMEPPSRLVLQGLGADLGKYQEQSSLDGYLIQQRDEITRYRRLYIQKLLGGNIPAANGVKAEFEKRFKIPLTVTKSQIRAAVKGREVGRSERILDRIPPEARGAYQQIVAETRGANQTVDPQTLTNVATSLQRPGRQPPVALDPAIAAAVRAELEKQYVPGGQSQQPTSFNPYSPFTNG